MCPCNPTTGEPLGGSGQPGADIYGHVTGAGGKPVPNTCITMAYVTDVVAQVRTDANGDWHYKFPGLGSHPMMWFTYTDCGGSTPGWAFPPTFFTMYAFNAGLTITIDAQVQPAAAISGIAVDSVGRPLPGAEIKLSDGYATHTIIADAAGRFTFTHLESIQVEVSGRAPHDGYFLTGLTSFHLTSGVVTNIALVLTT
jgi:hypothetical protein